jgi:predicted ATPase
VLGTYRDEEVPRSHPLSETLADVSRLPQFQRLHLSGLSRAETERFIAVASGLEPSPSLVAALYERTEGNPLYLTEMARWLLQDNRLQLSSRADRDVAAMRIPEGIREVVGRRLNRLSPSCNRLLKIAAVIGRTFWLDLLAKLAPESSQEAVLSALEEARSAYIIEELAQPGHFQFSHALIRETLYEERWRRVVQACISVLVRSWRSSVARSHTSLNLLITSRRPHPRVLPARRSITPRGRRGEQRSF